MPPLAVQIVAGLLLGIVAGVLFYGNGRFEALVTPVGDAFIRLMKMIVVPIVFSTLVVGIAGMGDIKKVGRLGLRTLVYFEVVTTIAIFFGIAVADLAQPGTGLSAHELAKADIGHYMAGAQAAHARTFVDMLVNVIPTNVIDAVAKGDMLAIIFFAVFFGLGIAAMGERASAVTTFFHGVADAMFWVTNQIMRLAPLGVFALIGLTVAKFGVASLLPLGKLILAVYVAMVLFVAIVLGVIARLAGIKLLALLAAIREELLLAFSTASSETVLARIIEKMEAAGCPSYVAGIVIPTGYTFNLTGSTLYQAIAALFVAQMYDIHLDFGQQLVVVGTLALTSKGMAGIPGASLIVLLATLSSVGLPVEGLAFVAGIDRILDMARTAVNVCGNALAAVVMTRLEGIRVTFDAPAGAEPAIP